MRIPGRSLVCVWVMVGVLGGASGWARQRTGGGGVAPAPTPDYSGSRPNSGALGTMSDLGDPATRHEMEEKRGKMLNVERQKAMVREAGQLVQMTAELQVSLAQEPQGAAREEAVRRIETIEKLARNVKERMKGGR